MEDISYIITNLSIYITSIIDRPSAPTATKTVIFSLFNSIYISWHARLSISVDNGLTVSNGWCQLQPWPQGVLLMNGVITQFTGHVVEVWNLFYLSKWLQSLKSCHAIFQYD